MDETKSINDTQIKKPIYKKWWFWVAIVLIIGAIGAKLDEAGQDQAPTTGAIQETNQENNKDKEKEKSKEEKELEKQQKKEEEQRLKEEQAAKDKEDYIASAQTFDYKELERNPDNFKGEVAVFTGKVIQVSESMFNTVIYRVNIKNDSGKWEDTIYVTYKRPEGESRILEDDIITIYGDLDGIETYTSVMAGKISIPAVKAKYIVIEQ